jgi:hypothetical protein
MRSIGGRLVPVLGLAAITVALLAGCVPESDSTPGHTSTPGSLSTPTETPTETIAPTPSPTAGTPAQPVSINCDSLVTLQQMYDFNPNFTWQANYSPKPGTAAYTAKAASGTACTWVNNTSGETLTISVARPGSVQLTTLQAAARSGTAVSGIGDLAYFAGNSLTVFSGTYWLVAQSTVFAGAADASSLAADALGALG